MRLLRPVLGCGVGAQELATVAVVIEPEVPATLSELVETELELANSPPSSPLILHLKLLRSRLKSRRCPRLSSRPHRRLRCSRLRNPKSA